MKLFKLLFAVVGATVLLGALASTASARSIQNSSRTFTATVPRVIFEGIFGSTDCIVTFSGSLHSGSAAKVAGSLVGYINDSRLGACATGTATILREMLPWHVRYAGFTGTLPNISSITNHVVGSSFRIRTNAGETCLVRTTAAEPAIPTYTVAANRTISAVSLGGTIATGPECFSARASFGSSGGTVRGSGGAVITVRLI